MAEDDQTAQGTNWTPEPEDPGARRALRLMAICDAVLDRIPPNPGEIELADLRLLYEAARAARAVAQAENALAVPLQASQPFALPAGFFDDDEVL